MVKRTNAQRISELLQAIRNCEASGNLEWRAKHAQRLVDIVVSGPSGSGWDCGTRLDAASTPYKLIFFGSWHHMDESGMYDGWTEHKIIVRPAFIGVDLTVTGRNRNGIKDYIGELFYGWLTSTSEAAL